TKSSTTIANPYDWPQALHLLHAATRLATSHPAAGASARQKTSRSRPAAATPENSYTLSLSDQAGAIALPVKVWAGICLASRRNVTMADDTLQTNRRVVLAKQASQAR